MKRIILLGLLLLVQQTSGADAPAPARIDWQEWAPAVFDRAKAEHKLVLLDLHAVWCHWCHVMDDQTYSDPKVISLIRSKYIAVGVDQDARPDLSRRYEDYGWPATVIFAPDGAKLAKRRGFIPPKEMAATLQAFIDDPTPGSSIEKEQKIQYSNKAALSDSLRKDLQAALESGYDEKFGSWGRIQKFLDWDDVEYCLVQAQEGNKRLEKMAKQTLAEQQNLIDPAWGGVYQYSTDGDWKHPHFEKLIQFQAENTRIYSLAYAFWKDPEYLKAATRIRNYVRDFLTNPEGAFYTSQDADLVDGQHAGEYFQLDDAARRKLGVPRVDTHIYARENGWMISALVQMAEATGETSQLTAALVSAKFISQERSTPDGGWRHDAAKDAGSYLGDEVAMGRAALDLYAATGDRQWLQRASDVSKFISDDYQPSGEAAAGLLTTAISGTNAAGSKPEYDENVEAARFANLLYHYTGDDQCRQLAECAMRYLATPEIAKKRGPYVGGILLADMEMNSQPLHIVVVGAKGDPGAAELFTAAAQYPSDYKQVEWQDRNEAPLHKEIQYPDFPKAAAYICTNNTCSAPIFAVKDLAPRIDRLIHRSSTAQSSPAP